MDVVRCRTLTHKSKLGFGKYADLTVGEIINLSRISYLRWAYFCLSKINFTKDVLAEILIPEKYVIEKPGKNEEFHAKLSDEISNRMSGFLKFKNESHNRRVRKSIYVNFKIRDNLKFNKANSQRINQGH
jgi:hypothetical protein